MNYFSAKTLNSSNFWYGKDWDLHKLIPGTEKIDDLFSLNEITCYFIIIYFAMYFVNTIILLLIVWKLWKIYDDKLKLEFFCLQLSRFVIIYVLLPISLFLFWVIIPLRVDTNYIAKFENIKEIPDWIKSLFFSAQKNGGVPTNTLPSGHVAYSLLGVYLLQIIPFQKKSKKVIIYSAWIFFWLIALSTLFCKKHYFLNAIVAILLIRIFEYLTRKWNRNFIFYFFD